MFESSHFETLKFIIPNFLCFHPIVFPVKREGHFSPLPPFSVSCILFVAPRRSLNETRHFRILSAARGINISGQFYAVPSDFPDSRSTYTRRKVHSAFLFSLFLSFFSFFFLLFLCRAAIFFGQRLLGWRCEVSFEIVERFGEKFLSPPFPCQGKIIIAPRPKSSSLLLLIEQLTIQEDPLLACIDHRESIRNVAAVTFVGNERV